jgi:hypothetical protein
MKTLAAGGERRAISADTNNLGSKFQSHLTVFTTTVKAPHGALFVPKNHDLVFSLGRRFFMRVGFDKGS